MRMKNRRVVVVAYNGLSMFEFGVVAEIFGLPRPEIGPLYSFSVCSVENSR